MLIPWLVFVTRPDADTQAGPYPLKVSSALRGVGADYPIFTCTSLSAADGLGGWEMSRPCALRGD